MGGIAEYRNLFRKIIIEKGEEMPRTREKKPLNNLKAEMVRGSVSVQEMAKRINLHRNTVSKYLAGDWEIPVGVAIEIAAMPEFKSCKFEYLFRAAK